MATPSEWLAWEEEIESIEAMDDLKVAHKAKYRYDPDRNNASRIRKQKSELLEVFGINSPNDIVLDPDGDSGRDFISTALAVINGEFKSYTRGCLMDILSTGNTGILTFDKQNNEVRQRHLFTYDAFYYSCFRKTTPTILFSVAVIGMDNTRLLHPMIRKLQAEKNKYFAKKKEKGEQGWDALQVPVYDIVRILDDQNMTIIHKGKKMSKQDFMASVTICPKYRPIIPEAT